MLRLGVFIVMFMWTLDKLVAPDHAACFALCCSRFPSHNPTDQHLCQLDPGVETLSSQGMKVA